jgi:hypothetical protein
MVDRGETKRQQQQQQQHQQGNSSNLSTRLLRSALSLTMLQMQLDLCLIRQLLCVQAG